jgi:signal transduction histidine kinase
MEFHVYPERDGAIVFFRDLTDRKHLEQSEARTRTLLQASLDALSAHIVILDSRGNIIAANAAWQRFATMYGLVASPAEQRLNYLALYCEPLARRPEAGQVGAALRSLLSGRRSRVRLVYTSQLSGHMQWFQLNAARFRCADDMYLVVVNEDVTAVKEAHHALGEAAERLLGVQEEERQRIAGELHDSTMQHLVAIGLNVMAMRTQDQLGETTLCRVREIEDSLEEASRELRSFTYLLYPPRLEEHGLCATLRRYVEGFASRTGLTTTLRAGPSIDSLPFDLKKAVLRTLQEALANVHRHASASRVRIDLRCLLGQLHLVVSDDGRGIGGGTLPSEAPSPLRLGVGLPGIAARFRQFGGELEVRSGPGGTRLHAIVPLAATPALGHAGSPAHFQQR